MATTALPATLTHREATATLKSLEGVLTHAPDGVVRVDASALKQFDTSAVALLLECHRLVREAGHRLQIDGLPAPLLELARLYGVETLLAGEPADAPRAGAA
jgi:phospholipid transport system transporter-binding protein